MVAKIVKLSKTSTLNNSLMKINNLQESINEEDNEKKINFPEENKTLRKSLSDKFEISSLSNTKNSLFLNTLLKPENRFANKFSNRLSSGTINISKKNKKHKTNTFSSDNLSIKSILGNDNFAPIKSYNENESDVSFVSYSQKNDYELNFINKSDDLRRSYIAKLIYKKSMATIKKRKRS